MHDRKLFTLVTICSSTFCLTASSSINALQVVCRGSSDGHMELPTDGAMTGYHADLSRAELSQLGGVAKAGPPPASSNVTHADLVSLQARHRTAHTAL